MKDPNIVGNEVSQVTYYCMASLIALLSLGLDAFDFEDVTELTLNEIITLFENHRLSLFEKLERLQGQAKFLDRCEGSAFIKRVERMTEIAAIESEARSKFLCKAIAYFASLEHLDVA